LEKELPLLEVPPLEFPPELPPVEPLPELPPVEPLPELPPFEPLPPLEPPPLELPPLALDWSETEICRDLLTDLPDESETETEKLKVPLELGVPEIFPVVLFRVTPVGKPPEAMLNP
jgi:hypothetical protein